jgi:hypothetical protein
MIHPIIPRLLRPTHEPSDAHLIIVRVVGQNSVQNSNTARAAANMSVIWAVAGDVQSVMRPLDRMIRTADRAAISLDH